MENQAHARELDLMEVESEGSGWLFVLIPVGRSRREKWSVHFFERFIRFHMIQHIFFGRDEHHDFSMILPCFFHVFLPQTGAGPENASIEEVAPMVLGALGEAVRSIAP
jgi:hypothetical protein